MNDAQYAIDWRKTSFEGSRREQLLQVQRMTVRQRLEALDELTRLSERLQALPRQVPAARASMGLREERLGYRADASRNDVILEGTNCPKAISTATLSACPCDANQGGHIDRLLLHAPGGMQAEPLSRAPNVL